MFYLHSATCTFELFSRTDAIKVCSWKRRRDNSALDLQENQKLKAQNYKKKNSFFEYDLASRNISIFFNFPCEHRTLSNRIYHGRIFFPNIFTFRRVVRLYIFEYYDILYT